MTVMITVGVVLLLINTVVLAVALLIVGEEINSGVLLRCLGLNVVALMVSFIPFLGFFSIVIWLAGLMMIFEKTFLEAVLVAFLCWVITLGTHWLIGAGLRLEATAESPTLTIQVQDNAYNFIDPAGSVVKTTESVKETVAALENPSLSSFITDVEITIRCTTDSNGLPEAAALGLSTKLIGHAGVRSVNFDYSHLP